MFTKLYNNKECVWVAGVGGQKTAADAENKILLYEYKC